MSDLPADYNDRLSLADLVARIERQQAETRKFVAERDKLLAEASKFRTDRIIAPVIAVGVLSGALGSVITLLLRGTH